MTVSRQMQLSKWSDMNSRPPFDLLATLNDLRADYATDPQSCVLPGDDTAHVVLVDDPGSPTTPALCQLLALRSAGDGPAAFSPGAPLTSLAPPSGYFAAEVRYAALWNDGVVAHLGSAAAPSLSRLSYYLQLHRRSYVTFHNLYDPSVFGRLADMRGQLRSVDFSVNTDALDDDEARGVFGTLFPAVFGGRVPRISISIGMGRRGARNAYLEPEIQEDALRLAESASDYVERMIIKGKDRRTGRVETVNLLRERITKRVDLPAHDGGGSIPSAAAAYDELRQFYTESQDTVRRATRMGEDQL